MDSRQLWTLSFFYLTAVLCRPTNGVTLQIPSSSPYLGDSVTVRCVGSDRERLNLHKNDTEVQRDSTHQITRAFNIVELRISPVSAEDQGLYSCVSNGNISLNQKELNITGQRRSIGLSPSRTVIPVRGSVTLTCSVEGYPNPQWLRRSSDSDNHLEILKEKTTIISVSRGGVYSCRGSDEFIVTEESNKVTIREIGLPLQMPSGANSGETVIVQCVGPVKTHLYFYKNGVIVKTDTNHWSKRTSERTVELRIHVSASDQGWYSCGINEGTLYTGHEFLRIYTGESPSVKLTTENHFIPNQGTVKLKCEAKGVSKYEWIRRSSAQNSILEILKEDTPTVTVSRGGVYSCSGKLQLYTLTAESDRVTIWDTAKPVPVLSVSPLWLSPGASVSLECNVTAPSAGWRFYWYRAVPLPSGSYSYELLPGRTSGTAHGSFTVHSLSSTAGFVCRASQGSPEVYTEYSPPQFVWSADSGSRVSPIVHPNSSQHLTYDPVSVSCGSSDEDWRVQMFSLTNRSLHQCPSHTEDKQECHFPTDEETRAVFWCESGRGEMTDAVNITIHNPVILLIPARPVPEGRSVSLTCKVGQTAELSSVRFYKDGQLIKEGSLTFSVSALSKSDEGLYKCSLQTSNQMVTSPESWLSVRSSEQSSSSVLVLVLVGAVFLIVLLILLLLLWRCRNNKDSSFVRSQETAPPEETYTELQSRDQEDIYHTIQEEKHNYDNNYVESK